MNEPILETPAREFAEAAAHPPLLHELGPEGARKALSDIQAGPIDKPPVEENWVTIPPRSAMSEPAS